MRNIKGANCAGQDLQVLNPKSKLQGNSNDPTSKDYAARFEYLELGISLELGAWDLDFDVHSLQHPAANCIERLLHQ
jgi:hypothetical protein